jgi:hypothetical protein
MALITAVHDMQHVLRYPQERQFMAVRVLDNYAATSIASCACIRMTDVNGNPSEAYWKCFVLNPDEQCGLLMNVSTIEKVMTELMNKMIEKNQEALLQIDDDVAVCKWLLDFKGKWEAQYRNQSRRVYDISEPVLAVMLEAVQKTDRIFQAHAPSIAPGAVRTWLAEAYAGDTGQDRTTLPVAQAVTRFYFRNALLAQYMCAIAGKIWKLQEVCDKPGAFPSTKQQNLLQKQLQDAVSNLVVALNNQNLGLPPDSHKVLYILDHKTTLQKKMQVQSSQV